MSMPFCSPQLCVLELVERLGRARRGQLRTAAPTADLWGRLHDGTRQKQHVIITAFTYRCLIAYRKLDTICLHDHWCVSLPSHVPVEGDGWTRQPQQP